MKYVKERHEAMLRLAKHARGNRLASLKQKHEKAEPKGHEVDEAALEAISSYEAEEKKKGAC